jgi:hypothetical protein
MVSALFAMTNRIGHIQSVKLATSMTGAREVIADAVFGLLARKSDKGLMNPAIVVKDDKAHRMDTGKI